MAKHRHDPDAPKGNNQITDPAKTEIANLVLDYDSVQPLEEEFKLANPLTKQLESYIMQEASADAGIEYRDARQKSQKVSPDGKLMSQEGVAEAQFDLLCACVFKRELRPGGREELTPINADLIRSLPDRAYKQLYQLFRKLNPEIDGEVSIEAIDKQISELQNLRARVLELRAGTAKNLQPATLDSSSSQQS